jgi:hypothetical protein
MNWPWKKKQTQEEVAEGYGSGTDGFGGYLPTLTPFFFAPLANQLTRNNDVYSSGYPPYPKAVSDHDKWYNNAYWGNRLPSSEVGTFGVSQRLWWKQYSPEQTIHVKQNLTGGAFPYGMSVQQSADILSQQSAAWKVSAGHA